MASLGSNQLVRVSLEAGDPGKGNEAALKAVFALSAATSIDLAIDSTALRNIAGQLQTIFADNADNAQQLIVSFPQSGQRIVIPPYSQGYYPILNLKGLQTNVNVSSTGGVDTTIHFINVPQNAANWSSLTTSAPGGLTVVVGSVTPGTFTDRSTTITAGGTAQVLMATNASRRAIIIENPTAETEIIYINFGSAGTAGTNNIELVPGGSLTLGVDGGPCTTQAIYVNAATTSHKIIAKEM